MKISVIVPVYNDNNIGRCLKSLANSTYKDMEVITMNDYGREGPATIRNRLAKKATGDILFFLDSDATVYPDTLVKIVKRFKNPKVDGVSIIWNDEPLENNFFSKFKALEMNYMMKHHFYKVCGSNGTAIRKKRFFEVGGFDKRYKDAMAEDFHFGLKVLSKYNIVFDKRILMQHSFCDRYFFKGMFKYCKRAFQRARLLVDNPIESSYNSKKLKLLYKMVILPPVFFFLNIILYLEFFKKYGLAFCLKGIILHYIYILSITIAGGLGLAYAKVFDK